MRCKPAKIGFDKAVNEADYILIGHTGEAGGPTNKSPRVSRRYGAPTVSDSRRLLSVWNQAQSSKWQFVRRWQIRQCRLPGRQACGRVAEESETPTNGDLMALCTALDGL